MDQSEIKNVGFEMCQMVLNYHGLLTTYWDVSRRPLPGPDAMKAYRGILTVFHSEKIPGPREYLDWLHSQAVSGKKLVLFGFLGGLDRSREDPDIKNLVDKVFGYLGLQYGGDQTSQKALIRYAHRNKETVGFEREYPLFPESYEKFKPVGKGLRVHLALRRTDKKDSESAVVVTGPNGGFAYRDTMYWQDPVHFDKQWYINPFVFFEEAFQVQEMPRPDPTTLNGLRVAFSHIDADGFTGLSRIDKKSRCAEVIRDQVIKKYEFPVTASVIAGEIDPRAVGEPGFVRLARSVFELPNVEPASHSYSHPYYWDPEYEEKEMYKSQYGIAIPGYTFDAKKEIDYSVRYISEALSPPHKTCRVFLWSGNCEPRESDIARCDALGVLNMNGGDTVLDDVNNSYTNVAPLYRKVGDRFQVHTGQANENIMTNLWTGPFYGFKKIVTTMARTDNPRRVAPLDIYYHFYSAEYRASLKAVQEVYEWALEQDTAKGYASDYIRMVMGYLNARIFRGEKGEWVIKDYGPCLTVRFDRPGLEPDLQSSRGVLGYTREPQGVYVSLAPGRDRAVVVMKKKENGSKDLPGGTPYLRKATGWVSGFQLEHHRIRIEYQGFGRGWIELGGLRPLKDHKIRGSAVGEEKRRIRSDKTGVLTVEPVKSGGLDITWH
jgi:hypothetical protein